MSQTRIGKFFTAACGLARSDLGLNIVDFDGVSHVEIIGEDALKLPMSPELRDKLEAAARDRDGYLTVNDPANGTAWVLEFRAGLIVYAAAYVECTSGKAIH